MDIKIVHEYGRSKVFAYERDEKGGITAYKFDIDGNVYKEDIKTYAPVSHIIDFPTEFFL
jgi:hypothetical protein